MKTFHKQAKLIKLQILLFTIFSSLVFTAQSVYAEKVATLKDVKGDVRIFAPGKTRGLKGRDGMALFAETRIVTTNDDSHANIIYNVGTRVRLMPNSELVLATPEPGDKDSLRVKVELLAGKFFGKVNKLRATDTFEIKTPTSTAGIKGTFFSVEAKNGETTVLVKEGLVEVANNIE